MKIKRCYVSFFNATQEIVGNMSFPKSRGEGDYQASYSEFALNQTTGFAEGLVEFEEQVWNKALEENLYKQGAACITILTFAHNDGNESAGAALVRVWKSAKGPGFNLVTSGECNAKLHAKAKEILQEDESAAVSYTHLTLPTN